MQRIHLCFKALESHPKIFIRLNFWIFSSDFRPIKYRNISRKIFLEKYHNKIIINISIHTITIKWIRHARHPNPNVLATTRLHRHSIPPQTIEIPRPFVRYNEMARLSGTIFPKLLFLLLVLLLTTQLHLHHLTYGTFQNYAS